LCLTPVAGLQLQSKGVQLPDILQNFVTISKTEKGFSESSALDKLGQQFGALAGRGADEVNACKEKIPDFHAYSNCILAAISGRMVSVDYSHLSDDEKNVFCHDAPNIFKELLGAVNARLETVGKNPPPPAEDKKDDGRPSSKVHAAMQDVIFTDNVLVAMNTFCAK